MTRTVATNRQIASLANVLSAERDVVVQFLVHDARDVDLTSLNAAYASTDLQLGAVRSQSAWPQSRPGDPPHVAGPQRPTTHRQGPSTSLPGPTTPLRGPAYPPHLDKDPAHFFWDPPHVSAVQRPATLRQGPSTSFPGPATRLRGPAYPPHLDKNAAHLFRDPPHVASLEAFSSALRDARNRTLTTARSPEVNVTVTSLFTGSQRHPRVAVHLLRRRQRVSARQRRQNHSGANELTRASLRLNFVHK